MLNDYILVKDKDGELKYFKDGKFFSVEEIAEQNKQRVLQAREPKKKELKPDFTLETQKKAAVKPIIIKKEQEKPIIIEKVPKKSSAIEKALEKTVRPLIPPLPAHEIEFEQLAGEDDFNSKRLAEQKLVGVKVDEAIKKLKIQFSDPQIESRFRNILTTFFRGVRTVRELGYMLGLPKVSGGLELPKDKISLILAVLEQELVEMNKERRQIAARIEQKPVDLEHRLEPPPPLIIKKPEDRSAVEKTARRLQSSPSLIRNEVGADLSRTRVSRPQPALQKNVFAPRPRIEDMKGNRQLIGPVEELETMELGDFRRLGREEQEIKKHLLEKFKVLADQSLLKKLQGLKAWKSSPVYKIYLSMTVAGIRNRVPLSQVIEDRQLNHQATLTLSEYEMIGQLNQELE